MSEIIQCEDCAEFIEVADGKNPDNVMRGHKIHCKGKQQEFTREERAKERTEPGRSQRVPFGVPRLHFKRREDDGFVYRVFNDNWEKEPGRIQRAKLAGYEEVDEPGSRQSVGVNTDGSAIIGVLMKIPKEFYDEDQVLKQKEIDKTDQQIQGGTFTEKSGDGRYIPQGGGIKQEVKLTP